MQKSKKVLSVIACAVASVLIFCYMCVVLIPKSDNDMFAARVFQGNGFKNEPENTLDVMFFGNSDTYAGVIPAKMYGEHGYTSYVCGRSLQTIETAEIMLREAYKTQSPKVVVLETDCLYEEKSYNIDESNLFVSPFIYHVRWKELKRKDFICTSSFRRNNHRADVNKGYNVSYKTYNVRSEGYMGSPDAKPLPISNKALNSLKEFLRLCEENDSKVVFIELPSPLSWTYAKHNYVKTLADEFSVPFIDFNTPMQGYNLDMSTDFRDNGDHLNHNGAQKTTGYIGNYIIDNYSDILLDKRDVDSFQNWNEISKDYLKTN